MYKVKRFSVFYDQREYGNKQNKEATRLWKLRQAGVSQSQADLMNKVNNPSYQGALSKSKVNVGENAEEKLTNWKREQRNLMKTGNTSGTYGNVSNVHSRINQRASDTVTSGRYGANRYDLYDSTSRSKARQNMASKSTPKPPTTPVATQTPTPKSSPTPQSNVNNPNKSRGLLDKGKNLWNKSGKLGKAGLVTAGLATIGAGAYGVNKMMNKDKK